MDIGLFQIMAATPSPKGTDGPGTQVEHQGSFSQVMQKMQRPDGNMTNAKAQEQGESSEAEGSGASWSRSREAAWQGGRGVEEAEPLAFGEGTHAGMDAAWISGFRMPILQSLNVAQHSMHLPEAVEHGVLMSETRSPVVTERDPAGLGQGVIRTDQEVLDGMVKGAGTETLEESVEPLVRDQRMKEISWEAGPQRTASDPNPRVDLSRLPEEGAADSDGKKVVLPAEGLQQMKAKVETPAREGSLLRADGGAWPEGEDRKSTVLRTSAEAQRHQALAEAEEQTSPSASQQALPGGSETGQEGRIQGMERRWREAFVPQRELSSVKQDLSSPMLGERIPGSYAGVEEVSVMDRISQLSMASDGGEVSQDVKEQVITRFQLMMNQGKERVTMHLHPEFLGKLRMHLFMQDHRLVAEIMTDNRMTHDLLNGQAHLLRESLADQGIQLERLAIHLQQQGVENGFGQAGQTFSQAFQEENQGMKQDRVPAPEQGDETLSVLGIPAVEGGVNLFV